MSQSAVASLGHNSGQTSLEHLLDPANIEAWLTGLHAGRIIRRNELLAGVARFDAQQRGALSSDETASRLVSFVKQIKDTLKDIEADRVQAKRPFASAAKTVDAFFNMTVPGALPAHVTRFEGLLTDFQRAKAVAEMRRRDEEAARLRAAAAAAAEEARLTQQPAQIESALEVAERAERAEAQSAKPVAEMGRARGALGGTSQFRTTYDFAVTDIASVPLQFMVIDRAALLAHIRQHKGNIVIPRIEVIVDGKATVA